MRCCTSGEERPRESALLLALKMSKVSIVAKSWVYTLQKGFIFFNFCTFSSHWVRIQNLKYVYYGKVNIN